MKHPDQDCTIRIEGEKRRDVTLHLSGHFVTENIDRPMAELQSIFDDYIPSQLTIDLSDIDALDSAGAMVLAKTEDDAAARSIPFKIVNMSTGMQNTMDLLNREMLAEDYTGRDRDTGILERMTSVFLDIYNDFNRVMIFVGELLTAMLYSILHPLSIRWADSLLYIKRVGVDGLPILGLISFLIGLIIAFMSSLQLKQFGANIYVASFLAIAVVRELGPIMTAILVAGRSGSAFAAEIGTMKVNEEIDALVVMGFDPVRFIAVPKVLAAMVAVPLLTLYADLFGILGGLVVGVTGLDLTPYTYIHQTIKSIATFDIISGIVKAVVFAVLISGISCQRGFETGEGAEAVGISATSAVVSSIFLIIVADSIFAIVIHYIR
ncbi:MAG: MlaE family lipid ABC transporter permease subunit [Thermodesulfobacteriota bacterium]|nr:MlaE family lipid ABC transporter permease subunit [Thermodesulfobacteriota bacterium]